MRLTGSERRRLEWIEKATNALVALAALVKPRVSLIDGFAAMEGEGPRYGRRLALGTVIAGTDPVAVDAVAASIMGFEPREIAYLRQAADHGSGHGGPGGDHYPRRPGLRIPPPLPSALLGSALATGFQFRREGN